jgi:hypothetical protein
LLTRNNLGDLGIDVWNWICGFSWFTMGTEMGIYEHANETSSSIIREFLEEIDNHHLLKNYLYQKVA